MIFEYIKEIWVRVLYSIYSFVGCFFMFFHYREEYLYFFSGKIWALVENGSFIFTGISEVFVSYFCLSILLSVYVFIWVLIMNVYLFSIPGLYEKEAKRILGYLVGGLIVFGGLFLFLHFNTLNVFCKYLLDYGVSEGTGGLNLSFEPRVSEFIYFIYKLDIMLLVILMSLCGSLCLISSSSEKNFLPVLYKSRKVVYICVVILIILLFPADILLHTFIFICISILFELSCLILCIVRQFAWWNW